jgi:hypothetical protein
MLLRWNRYTWKDINLLVYFYVEVLMLHSHGHKHHSCPVHSICRSTNCYCTVYHGKKTYKTDIAAIVFTGLTVHDIMQTDWAALQTSAAVGAAGDATTVPATRPALM